MGKVRVTNAGYLYFDFCYNGVRCREYTELRNTPDNLKIMSGAMKRIDGEIMRGTFVYARYFPESINAEKFDKEAGQDVRGCRFEEYALRWYKNNSIAWKPSVKKEFNSTLNRHLIPHFKDNPVAEITKGMVKEFRVLLAGLKGRRKGDKISNKRINNIILVLRMIVNEAAEENEFQSPFVNLKPLPVKKADIQPFSLEEVFRFLDAVPKDFYNYYVVRFFTGMRTAEIDGLKWKYVDFGRRKIMVRDTWQNNQWVGPKTESSVRDIDMMEIVERALLDQKEKTGSGEMVFCAKSRRPLDYNNISKRIWYPTLEKAGLAKRNPYQTRHTAATLWLASGENPEWVARQLGHSNTEMLFKVYSRFIPNLTRRDGSAFERFYKERLEESGVTEKNLEEERE